jgi:hypothetical protein
MSCTITGAKVEATVSFVNAPRADKRTRGRWNVFKRAESIGQLDLSGAVLVIAFFLSFFLSVFSFSLSLFWCFQASIVHRSIKYDILVYINIMGLGVCQNISVGEATAIAVSC